MENVFVARQPIFRRNLSRYGYELLFRANATAASAQIRDGDSATSEVIMNTFTVFGLRDLVGDSPAFINLTRRFIVESGPLPLPIEQTVIEVLEDVKVDDVLIEAIGRWRSEGYTIALDDFSYSGNKEPLLQLAHIIKLEVTTLMSPDAPELLRFLRGFDVRILAEKIEDHEQLRHCRELGCDYYQGNFLSRPVVASATRNTNEPSAVTKLLARIHDPATDLLDLERIISRDQFLSHKLLRYINSTYYRRIFEIPSLRQAVMMLGIRELRRWASIVALSLIDEKPEELRNMLLVRARMCELIAEKVTPDIAEFSFMAGLFSGLDALLDRPLEEILERLPLIDDVKLALLEHRGPVGNVLASVLAYEDADPSALHLPDFTAEQVRQSYLDALQWQQQLACRM